MSNQPISLLDATGFRVVHDESCGEDTLMINCRFTPAGESELAININVPLDPAMWSDLDEDIQRMNPYLFSILMFIEARTKSEYSEATLTALSRFIGLALTSELKRRHDGGLIPPGRTSKEP